MNAMWMHKTNEEFVGEFLIAANLMLDDDAIGQCYSFASGPPEALDLYALLEDKSNEEILHEMEKHRLIVCDGGNKHGDSWVACFHPNELVSTFVTEKYP